MPLAAANLFLSTHVTAALAASPTLMAAISLVSAGVLVGVGVWSLLQTFNHNPPCAFIRVWGQLWFVYLGFTMPWWLLVLVVALLRAWLAVPYALLLMTLAAVWFYLVYFAPRRIKVRYISDTTLSAAQPEAIAKTFSVAVLADIRLGLFSQPYQFEALVQTIQQLPVDAVLILGEWLYYPGADLVGHLMLLKTINKPVYVHNSAQDGYYAPPSTELLLRKDDLPTTFKSLNLLQVSRLPQVIATNLPASLMVAAAPAIPGEPAQPNTPQQAAAYPDSALMLMATMGLTIGSTGSTVTQANPMPNPSPNSTIPNPAQAAITLIPASDSARLSAPAQPKPSASVHIIPSFGQRGLPLRLAPATITVLQLTDQ